MALLRSIISRAFRPYTCLVVPKCQEFPHAVGFHTSQSRKIEINKIISDKPEEPKESVIQNETHESMFTPGKYFPTQDVYEMMIEGVRFDELPNVRIICTRNNTKAYAYTADNKTIAIQTGGTVGFKNAKKSTNVAAQAVGLAMGQDLCKKGLKNVRIIVVGTGTGRLPSIKGVQLAGVNIVSISDKTHPSINLRPRKARK